MQGDIRDGVAAYQKAVSLKPDLKEALFNMAQVRHHALCVVQWLGSLQLGSEFTECWSVCLLFVGLT